MKPRALEILKTMVTQNARANDDEDQDFGEIVRERSICMFGLDRISRSTLDELIMHGAISRSCDSDEQFERWTINETGEAIASNPEIARDVSAAYFLMRRFRIENGAVILEP